MNLHPGLMAVTIGCQLPANNGRIVRLIRKHVNSPEWDFKTTPAWWCESGTPMRWKHAADREVTATAGPIPESKLFPIQGPAPTPAAVPAAAHQGIPRCLLAKESTPV